MKHNKLPPHSRILKKPVNTLCKQQSPRLGHASGGRMISADYLHPDEPGRLRFLGAQFVEAPLLERRLDGDRRQTARL
jgi:hypothetical protein